MNNGTKADASTNTQNGTPPDDLALKVENLGKRYRLIDPASKADKLDSLWDYIALPWRRFKEIRSLTHFKEDDDENIFWALKDINFELKKGEVLGIIGRNGAGKSTLLKILSRITAPSEGRAVINGRVNSLLEVGTGFKSALTGRENVYMNGTIHGMSKKEIDDKIDEIAEFAGLEEGFLDIPVKRYSSGMKVRLGFAVAAHLEPEILIVDEVLAVGDAAFKRKCMGKMDDVTRRGRTVILVSHAMENIEQLCDRAIWLHEGQIVSDGDAPSIVKNYLDSFRDESQKLKLGERTDRQGSGEYVFADYRFTDFDDREHTTINTGIDLKATYLLQKKGDEVSNAHVAMNIRNINGKSIFACSTRMKIEEGIKLDKADHKMTFKIANFPLNAGTYFVDLIILKFVGGKIKVIDRLKEGIELNVQYGNFYGIDEYDRVAKDSLMYIDFETKIDSEEIEVIEDI